MPNPYIKYMNQRQSDLIDDIRQVDVCKPAYGEQFSEEVIEEGDVPSAGEMVKNVIVETLPLEFPDKLPHLIGWRYKLLLGKASPKELVPGNPPSLTWLENKYGHLVEKEFWYDRVVKLASTYVELCEEGEKYIFDMTMADLEKAAGHLVPYTAEEKEYLQLMENYKKSRLQIDGPPTLEFLRNHHAKPPKGTAHTTITQAAVEDVLNGSPQYLPDLSEGEEEAVEEALNVENRYVDTFFCPIHEDESMKCLNPDEEYGTLFFKCQTVNCPVFFTSNTHQDVCFQLTRSIHPTVHHALVNGELKCHCSYTPSMKLSQSEKNPGRVYLTCFKKNAPCNYFQ